MSWTPPTSVFKGTESYSGGTRYFLVTAAMTTVAQLIKPGGGRIAQVTNTVGPGQIGQTIQFWDWSDTTSYSSSGILLCTIKPGASAANLQLNPTKIDIPFLSGLVIVASAAVDNNVLVQYV